METFDLIRNFVTPFVFIAAIVIMVVSFREGKDERGEMISGHFFKLMFMLLSICIAGLIFISGWISIPYDVYRDIVSISFCLSYIIGAGYLLLLRKKY